MNDLTLLKKENRLLTCKRDESLRKLKKLENDRARINAEMLQMEADIRNFNALINSKIWHAVKRLKKSDKK